MGWETSESRWTNDRTKRLIALWGDGQSAEYIAQDLGGVTRNAVIGKVHRLGLERNENAVRRARSSYGKEGARKSSGWRGKQTMRFGKGEAVAKPSWTPKDIKPAAPKPPIPAVHTSTITGAIIPGPDPLPPTPIASPDPRAPTDHAITLMDITAKNCCWPVTDGKPEWLFCGESRDPKSGTGERGYCTKHHRWSVSSGLGRKRADVCVGVE